jgi:hypothetical protein
MFWEEQKALISPEVERLSEEQQHLGTGGTITYPRSNQTISQTPPI